MARTLDSHARDWVTPFLGAIIATLLFVGVTRAHAADAPTASTVNAAGSESPDNSPKAVPAIPAASAPVGDTPTSTDESALTRWSFLLVIPLFGIKLWRDHKRTGVIPFYSLLARFSPDAPQANEQARADTLSRVAGAAMAQIRFTNAQMKVIKVFFWLLLLLGSASLLTRFVTPLFQG